MKNVFIPMNSSITFEPIPLDVDDLYKKIAIHGWKTETAEGDLHRGLIEIEMSYLLYLTMLVLSHFLRHLLHQYIQRIPETISH